MNNRSELATTSEIASWQQWSVWLARTGYSDLELSTVMTLQQINRSKIESRRNTPARIFAAALDFERGQNLTDSVEIAVTLVLTAHEDRSDQ